MYTMKCKWIRQNISTFDTPKSSYILLDIWEKRHIHWKVNYSHTVAPKLIGIIVFPRNTTYIQQNLPPPPFFYCSTVWHWPDCSSGQIFFNQNSSEYITWSNFGSLAIKRHICIWNLNGRLKVKKTVCIMAWQDLRILKLFIA